VLVQDLPRAASISSGDLHSCAVANDRVYCWGYDDFGQLGYGLEIDSSSTPLAAELPIAGASAKVVAAGSKHTCAIYNAGLLACWGRGEDGQLGDESSGTGHFRYFPTRVVRRVGGALEFVNDAAKVAAGTAHTCAVSVEGKVECWGSNEAGQIGQDTDEVPASAIALRVPGLENLVVDDIGASGHLTCVRSGSDVLCWGSNAFYELARDDVDFSFSPVQIPLPSAARSIAVGGVFGCAATANGSAYCWGSNFHGERGNADPSEVSPNVIALGGVTAVFGGRGSHACAVRDTGAWCWGNNINAQLGDGSSSEDMEPVPRRVRGLGQPCL
jgi:alpha-tubulin suppressor-like RCC1 family protein